jgi:xylulokinase
MEVLPECCYALEYGEGCGTNVLDWLRDLLKLDEVEDLNALAATSPPGARGVRVRPRWWAIRDPNEYGSIQGLRSYHNRADVIRSTLEGLVFELARSFNKLTYATGFFPERVALCGGASRSALLCQMIADILDVPVFCGVNPEASALGAALTAAQGVGWSVTIAEASNAMVRHLDLMNPNRADRDLYRKLYQEYG